MRIKNMKVLTGSVLSLAFCVATVAPAMARPVVEGRQAQLVAQTDMMPNEMVRGTVQSIRNDQVTLELPNGETRVVEISEDERDRLGILPGMTIEVMMDDTGDRVAQVRVIDPTMANDSTVNRTTTTRTTTTTSAPRMMRVDGEVISCDGTTLQLRLNDGTIESYAVTPAQCDETWLRPGTRVTLETDERKVVNNIERPQPVRALW
jgi:translation elongation factor P/translation initiation factor 5A